MTAFTLVKDSGEFSFIIRALVPTRFAKKFAVSEEESDHDIPLVETPSNSAADQIGDFTRVLVNAVRRINDNSGSVSTSESRVKCISSYDPETP